MTSFQCTAETNDKKQSVQNVPGYLMPARAFFFIIVEEVGKDGFLVRKIYASAKDPYLLKLNLSEADMKIELTPEKYGLTSRTPGASLGVAEHVMGQSPSPFRSTSSIFPEGSPRFVGRTIFVDIDKAKRAGAKLISTQEILADLERYKAQNPHLAKRINKIAGYVKDADQEILIGGKKVPAAAVFNKETLSATSTFVKSARVVQVLGIVLTAYDLAQASRESYNIGSAKPITAEVVRQAGGWGMAAAGFKVGGVVGAALGIETGPGAILTGAIGGIVFGTAGYFGADWVADHIYAN